MRIISTFIAPEHSQELGQHTLVTVFDTLVQEKSVVVGITVGVVQGNQFDAVRVSPVGQAVVQRLAAHWQRNYPDGPVVIAGVAKVAGAKERVRQVLAKAPEHAAVLLVCVDNKVYDAAFTGLGVDYGSANMKTQ